MKTKIFVNLPVKDLPASMKFFRALGYEFNPQFSDDTAACLVISEEIYAMLLTHEKFKQFTPKKICDTATSAEMLLCLSCESREQVDGLVKKALAAGGTCSPKPTDHGFMYEHDFTDLDGHGWGLFYMESQPSTAK